MKPKFFATPAAWRDWLEKHHGDQKELLVGFYKKASGKPSITWPESVDGALSFGWIDGVRRRIDDVSYSIRFTPRRPRSIWSAVNIKRVEELSRLGLMHARPPSVRSTPRSPFPNLLIRAEQHPIRKCAGASIPSQRSSVEILPVTTAFVSAARHLAGYRREAGGD